MVLGAIIEAVSGQSYHDYVRQHIFSPGRHERMTAPLRSRRPDHANIAIGYTTMGADHEQVEPCTRTRSMIPHTGTPAGGGYSTAHDLLAFRHAFFSTRNLLDGRYTEWVVATDELPDAAPRGYAGRIMGSESPVAAPASTRCSKWRANGRSSSSPTSTCHQQVMRRRAKPAPALTKRGRQVATRVAQTVEQVRTGSILPDRVVPFGRLLLPSRNDGSRTAGDSWAATVLDSMAALGVVV